MRPSLLLCRSPVSISRACHLEGQQGSAWLAVHTLVCVAHIYGWLYPWGLFEAVEAVTVQSGELDRCAIWSHVRGFHPVIMFNIKWLQHPSWGHNSPEECRGSLPSVPPNQKAASSPAISTALHPQQRAGSFSREHQQRASVWWVVLCLEICAASRNAQTSSEV